MAMSFKSILTCPMCGHEECFSIPYEKQLMSFTCSACLSVIKTPDDQCCIFCAFGSDECLAQQGWQMLEEKMRSQNRNKLK